MVTKRIRKLSDKDKEEILSFKGKKAGREVAKLYNVSHQMIYKLWQPKRQPNISRQNKLPKPTPGPELVYPRIDTKPAKTQKTIRSLPSFILTEKLLTKYKDETKTTKYLYDRLLVSKKDSGLIKALLEFYNFCEEKGEL